MISPPTETDLAPPSLGRVRLAHGWTARVLTSAGSRPPAEMGIASLPRESQWVDLLSALVEDPAGLPGYEVLKYSKAAQVFRANLAWDEGSLEVVCKQSLTSGWRRLVPTPWRMSRERRDFDCGLALLRAHLPAAWPLALLERHAGLSEAKLVTAFVKDAVDLDQLALRILPRFDAKRARRLKNSVLASLVELIFRLQQHKLYHRDLKASNVLVTRWDRIPPAPRLWLVDWEGIHRVRRRRIPTWRMPVRLGASLIGYAGVTRSDYARFLRQYLVRLGHSNKAWKAHAHGFSRRMVDYRQRAGKRKTHKLDGYQ